MSPGPLQGRFRIERQGSIILISVQANQALFAYGQRNPDLQRKLSCSTVKDVAEHFGFHSRNHFAQDYRLMFDATPRDTFQSAPI